MSRCWAGLIAVLALVAGARTSEATALFSGSGNGLSASASFTISGAAGNRQLTILLSNTDSATGSNNPYYSSDVLTGLFFNLGTSSFTPVSATIQSNGSIIQTSTCDVDCAGAKNVGGEFSYAQNGKIQGISSSAYLDKNNGSGNFTGTNYDGGPALGGLNFGLVPDGFPAFDGGSSLDRVPLIEGTVKFVLKIPNGLEEGDIKNVYFTYGDEDTEATLRGTMSKAKAKSKTGGTSVPEPAVLSMFGLALAGIGYRLRRSKRKT